MLGLVASLSLANQVDTSIGRTDCAWRLDMVRQAGLCDVIDATRRCTFSDRRCSGRVCGRVGGVQSAVGRVGTIRSTDG